jgi:Mg/Co/Ni transporter MgtE
MEPDEAAGGLRELDPGERQKLLAAMPPGARDRVQILLGYGERTAGGMITVLVLAHPAETIAAVRDRLLATGSMTRIWPVSSSWAMTSNCWTTSR